MDIWPRTFLDPTQPGFWIVLSFALWLPIKLTASRWSARKLRWLNLARWVLIPYAGLMAGSLSPRLMGLINIDWYMTLGIGVALTMAMLAMIVLIRLLVHGREENNPASLVKKEPMTASERGTWAAGAVTVIVSGAEQFHWTFLRGAIWEILLLSQSTIDQPGYWAAWIAAFLALPEVLLQPLQPMQRLVKVAILAMTTILFIFTQNFWLCWAFHAMMWLLLATTPQAAEIPDST